jgi:spore coat protein H
MDKSGATPENTYKDYGLYTHTEQPGKDFLNAHNLDVNGNLYKALSFEFFRYQNEIKNIDDPTYSKELFETRLNMFAGKDNRKLINMLDALNSNDVDINAVVDKYFDKDNYLTWMAINILLGNYDTTSQNYLLYSPLNSEKWYFIPWDYDGTMKNTKLFLNFFTYMPDSQKGLARYWGVNLHKRFFAYKENCDLLTKKINEVKKVFIDNDFSGVATYYNSIVWSIISNSDDIKNISTDGLKSLKAYLAEFNIIIEKNYQLYLKSIHSPMPNFLLDNKKVNNKWQFRWTPSQDIDGDIVRYHFQLATDPYFKNIVEEKKEYFSTDYTLTKDLAKGHYFYRVVIDDGKGNTQLPYDTYDVSDEEQAFGLREFYVE